MRFFPLLVAILLASGTVRAAPATASRPNIVILLADDLGHTDVGFAGGTAIHTPHIDQLAASGARLDAFYVQPLCSPTRAALMTGRYPMRYGLQVGVIRPYEHRGLPLTEHLLPEVLRTAGYRTAVVGKWHLGFYEPEYLPTHRGFETQYGHYNGEIDYFTHVREGGFDWHRNDAVCRDEGYSTHLIAKEAIRLIEGYNPAQPFFLYVPFNGVHAPWQVPESYKAPYAALPEPRRTYAGMLAAVDEAVGQIVTTLQRRGLLDNTLILFSSDNGGPLPGRVTDNAPFRAGKGSVYEGGTRVCACVSWAGHITSGSAVAQPLHVVDWFPTFLKLAGVAPDAARPLDGRDIWPVLADGRTMPDREILMNSTPAAGALRVGDWKFVVHHPGARSAADQDEDSPEPSRRAKKAKKAPVAREDNIELFNLAADPSEKHNLAADEPARLAALRERYEAYARAAVAPANQPQPANFKPPAVWGENSK